MMAQVMVAATAADAIGVAHQQGMLNLLVIDAVSVMTVAGLYCSAVLTNNNYKHAYAGTSDCLHI
jgi:hypothetical protein